MSASSVSASILDAALEYAQLGWQVFPCHPTGHQPLVKGGFYAATTDIEPIKSWWARWPGAAIGLRTGQDSGLFAVDIDPRNGGDISLEFLEGQHGALPETIESHTGGGGRHLLFRWPGQPVPCSVGKIGAGIDVKGDGGYIILPPSDHESGRRYCWLIDQEPGEHELAEAPAWLMDMIMQPQEPHRLPDTQTAAVQDVIPEGYRNKTLASQAGHMRQIGMSAEEIAPALQAVNLKRCRPPLDTAEVDKIASSIGRYDSDCRRQAEIEHWPERYLGKPAKDQQQLGLVLTRLADVQPRDVEWLWPRRIAVGKITMLAGDPGLGKSFCSIDIAARVSAGLPWPDLPDQRQEPGDVIVLSAEDALDDTIRPRLDAAGADTRRICAIEAVREFDPLTGKPRQRGFCLDKDICNLEQAIRQMDGCRLVVIDPVSAYLGDANSHNNAEVRALLAPLSDLAARHRVAILCISHLNKGVGDAMYRIMGSLAFVAAARAGYVAVKDRHDDTGQRRLVLPIKNNLGDDASGLAYRIMETPGNDHPHVEWEREVVYTTVKEALGTEYRQDDSADSVEQKQQHRTQIAEAVDWLMSYLSDGEKAAKDVIAAAAADGISRRTLERAKPQAGVVARREGFSDGGRWMWRLINIDALMDQAKAATMN